MELRFFREAVSIGSPPRQKAGHGVLGFTRPGSVEIQLRGFSSPRAKTPLPVERFGNLPYSSTGIT
jgi:hypothetical protein